MKKYKGVIFDFNGTLYWDTTYHDRAWITFAEEYAGRNLTKEELDKNIHGLMNKVILKNLFQRQLSLDEIEKYSGIKEELYRKFCREDRQNLRLSKGAPQLFDYLKSKNIPFTIASSANEGNMLFYFRVFHLEQWFDFNRVIYDNGMLEGKPSPQPFVQAAAKIGLLPEDCIICEDSALGIQSARNAKAGYIYRIATAEYKNTDADKTIETMEAFDVSLLEE
jgi:beta-phosphoglucomutase